MIISREAYRELIDKFDMTGFKCKKCGSNFGVMNEIEIGGEVEELSFSCTNCLSTNTVDIEIRDC